MNHNIYSILLKSTMVFVVLLILTRLLGKKQMGHLSFFNYITGITIGSIAANIVSIENENFYAELLNLGLWCALTIVLDYLSINIPKTKLMFSGEPTIVIKKGLIDKKMLKKQRLTLDNLTMLLREEGVFSVTEVEYAILESNGEITVFKKEDYRTVLRKDLNIKYKEPKYLPSKLIVDGHLVKQNLEEYDLDEKWLMNELNKQSIKSYKDVLYAELQINGDVHIQKKGDTINMK